jgi:hypothetical protein
VLTCQPPFRDTPEGWLYAIGVADFISECWPASFRNSGRLQIGIHGRLPSESSLSAHDPINNLFLLPCHRMTATDYRADRTRAFQAWHDVCGITPAA